MATPEVQCDAACKQDEETRGPDGLNLFVQYPRKHLDDAAFLAFCRAVAGHANAVLSEGTPPEPRCGVS